MQRKYDPAMATRRRANPSNIAVHAEPRHPQKRTALTGPTAPQPITAAGGPPSPASPPLPALKGHHQWLKDQLQASADATDPLSVYIMRKHSRRFLPGSQYHLELAQTQRPVGRLLGSISPDNLQPVLPPRGGRDQRRFGEP